MTRKIDKRATKAELTADRLLAAMKACQHQVFNGDLNLNLIGIRNKDTKANTFNDRFCVLYQLKNKWQLKQFKCTTDPGTYYRENPLNVDGTAIVVPGQHRSLWTFGYHQGKYPALVQHQPVTVFRDNDKDSELDMDVEKAVVTQTGYFGINCHRANAQRESTQVDKWSAGCQVFADPGEFNQLIELCRQSSNDWGSTFTYTLLTEKQLANELKESE